jgi:RNA methyltransferase, TrmH family
MFQVGFSLTNDLWQHFRLFKHLKPFIILIFVHQIENQMPDPIISSSNPRIQSIIKLQANSRERRSRNLFVIEGYREISRAMISGIEIKELYVCPELDRQGGSEDLLHRDKNMVVFEVGKNAFARIAYREGSDGLIALAVPRTLNLSDLKLSAIPLILIIEAVEKPGNLGAIMRTADAAGIDAVIVCDPLTDIYNPNAIRSGVGCIFTCQIATCTSAEALAWLRSERINIFAAALSDKALAYHKADFRVPAAIVMGTEATGLSREWLENSDAQIIIPMKGIADSLNVSTSAAVLVYEAVRQREN